MRYLIAALLLAPAAAFAGGYAIPNENARDLALSQSTVAAQNGPEAAHTNPSALAGQQGLAVTANLEMLYNVTTWSAPSLGQATLQPKANYPPELAATIYRLMGINTNLDPRIRPFIGDAAPVAELV